MLTPDQQECITNLSQKYKPLLLWNGSISEFVSNPTPLTFSTILEPFNNSELMQRATQQIGMPSFSFTGEYIVNVLDHAYFNLDTETNMFFGKHKVKTTIIDENTKPNVQLNLNIFSLLPALPLIVKHVLWQSKLVSTEAPVRMAKSLLEKAEAVSSEISHIKLLSSSIAEYEKLLELIIAIGMLDSSLDQYIFKVIKPKYSAYWDEVEAYTSELHKMEDYYFQSFHNMNLIAAGKKSFSAYIQEFGDRSFNDYELASPRFRESSEALVEIINSYPAQPIVNIPAVTLPEAISETDKKLLTHASQVRAIRGTIRMKSLKVISRLRKLFLETALEKDIPSDLIFYMTKKEVLDDPPLYIHKAKKRKLQYEKNIKVVLPSLITEATQFKQEKEQNTDEIIKTTPVSQGTVTGKVLKVTSEFVNIQDAHNYIFLLPDSSPRYSHLYPLAAGIIFEIGGMMSHGAIVAREYGKPAVTLSGKPIHLPEGTEIELNASIGTIQLK